MQDKISYKTQDFPFPALSLPLKAMSAEEFAELGANSAMFLRQITGEHLASFIPEATGAPEDGIFQMIMSASGAPILVTDSTDAVHAWLEDNDITLVQRH